MNKTKPRTPPNQLRQEPQSQTKSDASVSVQGVVSIEVLIVQFRASMEEVLDARLSTISSEIEAVKVAFLDIENCVQDLEKEKKTAPGYSGISFQS